MAKEENEFKKRVDLRDTVYEKVKELLKSTTEEQFKKLGYKPVEKYYGEYSTGDKFGTGSEAGKFNIRLIGKTKSFIEKDIILGAKRTHSLINMDLIDTIFKIHYNTTETSVGRYNEDGPLLITSSISLDTSKNYEKDLKKFLSEIAKQEVYYITETKLGIEDKVETHTDTISENNNMKLTLKSLFFGSFEETEKMMDEFINEAKKKEEPTVEPGGAPTKKIEADDSNLLFDDEESDEKDEVSEVTTAGSIASPGTAGPFQYNTPYMFKKSMQGKKDDNKRASIKKEKTGDGFWTTVDIEPLKKTHPSGMPGVQLNSKSEVSRSMNGNKGLNESIDLTKRKFVLKEENESLNINKRYIITQKLTAEEEKAKWAKLAGFSVNESIKNAEDVIQECGCGGDEMSDDDKVTRSEYEEIVNKEFSHNNNSDDEFEALPSDVDAEDVITVSKPDSFVSYKFQKDEFLNENKYFILDLMTKEFVINPNHVSLRK